MRDAPGTPPDAQAPIDSIINIVHQALDGNKVEIATVDGNPVYFTVDSAKLLDSVFLAEQQAISTDLNSPTLAESTTEDIRLFIYYTTVIAATCAAILVATATGTAGAAALAAYSIALVSSALSAAELLVAIINALNGDPGLDAAACSAVKGAILDNVTEPLEGLGKLVNIAFAPAIESGLSYLTNLIPAVRRVCSPTPTPTPTASPTPTPTATATPTPTPPDAGFDYSFTNFDFALQVPAGKLYSTTLAFDNNGDAPLTIDAVNLVVADPYLLTGLSQTNDCGSTIQPGNFCTITLTFDASQACGDSAASGVRVQVTDSLPSNPTEFHQQSFVFIAEVLGGCPQPCSGTC